MQQIKVQFCREESGRDFELWRTEPINGKRKYLGREMSGNYRWFYVDHAPNEPCEPVRYIEDSITIIICDKYGKEIMKDGNDTSKYPCTIHPFRKLCVEVWQKIREQYFNVRTDSLREWLCQDTNITELAAKDNWEYNHKKVEATTIINTFQWISESYTIVRSTMTHEICHKRWYEYAIFKTTDKEFQIVLMYLGWEIIN